MATKTKTTTPAQAEQAIAAAAPALQFIPLDMIEALPQVRKAFDDASLAELAESIKALGMLQPVLLRSNTSGIKYTIIAGERRVRAARLAGLDAVPALVGDVAPTQLVTMQLVENIQRDELSLAETAEAIKALFAVHKSQKALCAILSKSPAWVSKRMAFAHGLHPFVENLLTDGVTDDLELLLSLQQLKDLNAYSLFDETIAQIRDGKAGRKEVRERIAGWKKSQELAVKEKAKAKKTREEQARQMPLEVQQPKAFYARGAIHGLSNKAQGVDFDICTEVANYTPDEQALIVKDLSDHHYRGNLKRTETTLVKLRALNAYLERFSDELATAAFILGLNGQDLSLEMALNECRSMYLYKNT